MKELCFFRLPLRREMMTTARLAAGGVCAAAGMSYDGGEDCKVCITESLLLLMRRGYAAAGVSFTAAEGGLRICVTGEEGAQNAPLSDEDEIALALLSALAADVTMEREGEALSAIAFTFGQQA